MRAPNPAKAMGLSSLWSNGHKPLVLAFLYFVGSVAVLSTVLLWQLLPGGGEPQSPIEFKLPYRISTPQVVAGEEIHAEWRVCSYANRVIPATYETYWRRVDSGNLTRIPSEKGTVPISPGCADFAGPIVTTEELTPGTWSRSGRLEFDYAGHHFNLPFYSEPFEVVAP